MPLPDDVAARTATTDRTTTHYYEKGPDDGTPVVLVHGNLATGRFFDGVLAAAPGGYRVIAPDMRSFGDSAPDPIDGTRGVRDWADDTRALVAHLGIDGPVHLVGWSTGGAAVANYATDHPDEVASVTLIDPVSPYGFGGTKGVDGTPVTDDFAGSGGGVGSPDLTAQIEAGDMGADSDFSPRNVMRAFYWSPSHEVDSVWEDELVAEVLKSVTGDDGYPGDATESPNWPGVAPGTRGILNALSGKYCRWDDIVDISPKPPVLWTHGTDDMVVSNRSMWDMAVLGEMGAVPEWPGSDVFPAQPMVDQIDAVLDRYAAAGGTVHKEMFEGSGHGPHIDAADRWNELFWGFVASN